MVWAEDSAVKLVMKPISEEASIFETAVLKGRENKMILRTSDEKVAWLAN